MYSRQIVERTLCPRCCKEASAWVVKIGDWIQYRCKSCGGHLGYIFRMSYKEGLKQEHKNAEIQQIKHS